MTEYKDIYKNRAEKYDKLVKREDHKGNIAAALFELGVVDSKIAIEIGCGTGRITTMLCKQCEKVYAFDLSLSMLEVARRNLNQCALKNYALKVADHRSLPIAGSSADLVVAGWTLCHTVDDYPQHWRAVLMRIFNEIKRVLKANGLILIFETLGTGYEKPSPPKHLQDYFQLLEKLNFSKTWFRTDYAFESIEEAQHLTRFFFGAELASRVRKNRWHVLPECTGLWRCSRSSLRIIDGGYS